MKSTPPLVYRPDGRQVRKYEDFSTQAADEAVGRAEDYLRTHAERLTEEFESWV